MRRWLKLTVACKTPYDVQLRRWLKLTVACKTPYNVPLRRWLKLTEACKTPYNVRLRRWLKLTVACKAPYNVRLRRWLKLTVTCKTPYNVRLRLWLKLTEASLQKSSWCAIEANVEWAVSEAHGGTMGVSKREQGVGNVSWASLNALMLARTRSLCCSMHDCT